MEDNFRNALIILSGVVIAAIFIHGMWTIRKQKNPYKLKASKEKVQPLSRDFDRSGFDQDGVGQVKVLKQDNEPEVESEKDFEQNISLEEISHLENGQSNETYNELNSKEQVAEHDTPLAFSEEKTQETVAEDNAKEEITLAPPLYQQPVTQAKPRKAPNKKNAAKAEIKKGELKRNQMEINFGEGVALDEEAMPNMSTDKTEVKAKPAKKAKTIDIESQVIILSVVMPESHHMSGAALLPSLLTLGLKYGEMNIFHRHQDNAGNGAVTFSLANMLNPGSFDLDSMETFATQGVSLFMTLPNASDPFAAFEQMLAAAKQLAVEFGAQLLDDKRNIMTKQTEQHYVSKIREFDRQYRLASV